MEQDEKINYRDLAAKIKADNPYYKDKDDFDLVTRFVKRYPDYQGRVDFSDKKKESSTSSDESASAGPSTLAEPPTGISEIVGRDIPAGTSSAPSEPPEVAAQKQAADAQRQALTPPPPPSPFAKQPEMPKDAAIMSQRSSELTGISYPTQKNGTEGMETPLPTDDWIKPSDTTVNSAGETITAPGTYEREQQILKSLFIPKIAFELTGQEYKPTFRLFEPIPSGFKLRGQKEVDSQTFDQVRKTVFDNLQKTVNKIPDYQINPISDIGLAMAPKQGLPQDAINEYLRQMIVNNGGLFSSENANAPNNIRSLLAIMTLSGYDLKQIQGALNALMQPESQDHTLQRFDVSQMQEGPSRITPPSIRNMWSVYSPIQKALAAINGIEAPPKVKESIWLGVPSNMDKHVTNYAWDLLGGALDLTLDALGSMAAPGTAYKPADAFVDAVGSMPSEWIRQHTDRNKGMVFSTIGMLTGDKTYYDLPKEGFGDNREYTFASGVIDMANHILPEFFASMFMPPIKLAALAKSTNGLVTQIPKFTQAMALRSFLNSYGSEPADNVFHKLDKAVGAGVHGALEGTYYHSMGLAQLGFARYLDQPQFKDKLVQEPLAKLLLSNGMAGAMFSGSAIINGIAEGADQSEYLKESAFSFVLPYALSARAILSTAISQTYGKWLVADKYTKAKLNEIPIDPFDMMAHGLEKMNSKKTKEQMSGFAIWQAGALKVINKVVADNPEAFKKEIREAVEKQELSPQEGDYWMEAIDTHAVISNPLYKVTAPLLERLAKLEESKADIEGLTNIDYNLQQARVEAITHEIENLKTTLGDIVSKYEAKKAKEEPTVSRETEAKPEAGASVPVMITKKMKSDLADLGYSTADIENMTPEKANEIISGGIKNEVKPKKTEEDAGKKQETVGMAGGKPSGPPAQVATRSPEKVQEPAPKGEKEEALADLSDNELLKRMNRAKVKAHRTDNHAEKVALVEEANAIKAELEKRKAHEETPPAPKPEVGKEQKLQRFYRGGAEGAMPKGLTANDVIQYEQKELGNNITVEKGVDPEKIKSDNLEWVAANEEYASQFGDVTVKDLTEGSFRIVARDTDGGILIEKISNEIAKPEDRKDYAKLNQQHADLTKELLSRQKELISQGVKDFTSDQKWNEIKSEMDAIEAEVTAKPEAGKEKPVEPKPEEKPAEVTKEITPEYERLHEENKHVEPKIEFPEQADLANYEKNYPKIKDDKMARRANVIIKKLKGIDDALRKLIDCL